MGLFNEMLKGIGNEMSFHSQLNELKKEMELLHVLRDDRRRRNKKLEEMRNLIDQMLITN